MYLSDKWHERAGIIITQNILNTSSDDDHNIIATLTMIEYTMRSCGAIAALLVSIIGIVWICRWVLGG